MEKMKEKTEEALSIDKEHEKLVLELPIPSYLGKHSFYEGFFLRGITVDRVEPGYVSCTFKVPPRLTDRNGNLSPGAIANWVDAVAFAAIESEGHRGKVSTDMSIAYMTTAKLDDELEIVSRVLEHKGGYAGTQVVVTNKKTREIIAEGRHSLFGLPKDQNLSLGISLT